MAFNDGAKMSDIVSFEDEERSISRRSKEYKKMSAKPTIKRNKTKKLKNILQARDYSFLDKLSDSEIEDKIIDALNIYTSDTSEELYQLILNTKTRLYNISNNENLILIAYEVCIFCSKLLSENCMKLTIKVKDENIKLKMKKVKTLDKSQINKVKEYIQNDIFFFDTFTDCKNTENETDTYIENPTQITSGVIRCGHCDSDKTYSWQKQVRSADEPMTTFFHCMTCGKGGKLSS